MTILLFIIAVIALVKGWGFVLRLFLGVGRFAVASVIEASKPPCKAKP